MPFAVEPLSPDLPFGVTIRGLRRAQLDDPEIQERLRHHWIQDGLVVFRDGDNDQDGEQSRLRHASTPRLVFTGTRLPVGWRRCLANGPSLAPRLAWQ